MSRRHLTSATLVGAALSLLLSSVPHQASAAPTVIRDERLLDLGVTPTVGRGYSPSSNQLHSVCFSETPTTVASFDFDYAFEQLQLDEKSKFKKKNQVTDDSEVKDFVPPARRPSPAARPSGTSTSSWPPWSSTRTTRRSTRRAPSCRATRCSCSPPATWSASSPAAAPTTSGRSAAARTS
jgi:hypothetical protein